MTEKLNEKKTEEKTEEVTEFKYECGACGSEFNDERKYCANCGILFSR